MMTAIVPPAREIDEPQTAQYANPVGTFNAELAKLVNEKGWTPDFAAAWLARTMPALAAQAQHAGHEAELEKRREQARQAQAQADRTGKTVYLETDGGPGEKVTRAYSPRPAAPDFDAPRRQAQAKAQADQLRMQADEHERNARFSTGAMAATLTDRAAMLRQQADTLLRDAQPGATAAAEKRQAEEGEAERLRAENADLRQQLSFAAKTIMSKAAYGQAVPATTRERVAERIARRVGAA